MKNNIHPTFDKLVQRSEKESLLGQKGIVLWFTGLSGSGKSTISQRLERMLFENGKLTMTLDGDNVRTGLCANLSFSEEDRAENIRRVAEVAKLFAQSGIITICTFISPTLESRRLAREIIGDVDFVEVFVDTPLEECERRDVKGLYQKARAGHIKGFTGIDQAYEKPQNAEIVLKTKEMSVDKSVETLMKWLADN